MMKSHENWKQVLREPTQQFITPILLINNGLEKELMDSTKSEMLQNTFHELAWRKSQDFSSITY